MTPRTTALVTLSLLGCSASPSPASSPQPASPPSGSAAVEAASGPAPATGDATRHHYFHREEKPHPAEWGYGPDDGPARWADLDPSYALARSGTAQSPIDLPASPPAGAASFAVNYTTSRINLVYNGHTIEEMEEAGSVLSSNGVEYDLAQFHFHSPSEHTINGEHAAMEMHLVHKSDTGAVAVLAVLIEPGPDDNPAFDSVWDYLPTSTMRSRTSPATVDPAAMLPGNLQAYSYEGSFTTPPCTEGVSWFVIEEPARLSQAQIDTFRAIIKDNNRPPQALNGRSVTHTR